jgi:UDP-N-acetylmuramate--alanine ligase
MLDRVHFIGIGGSGLSAIARLLAESGVTVTGSDRSLSPFAQELRSAGIHVSIGHASENVSGASLVVRSSAVADDNPEVIAARQAGIPVLKRADFLGRLMENRDCIAVAGTHGKTTTTAMIAWILTRLQQDPSYIIGGVSANLGSNAHAGSGAAFVIEADEYDRMFLGLAPKLALVTYLEHDHPDCYPTFGEYRQAFVDFIQRIQPGGSLFVCADQPAAASLAGEAAAHVHTFTYSLSNPASYTLQHLGVNASGGSTGSVVFNQASTAPLLLGYLDLQVPGKHNASNAVAALAVAHRMGLSTPDAAAALNTFAGTGRRFELRGEVNGITLIDDYAHHPTEIRSTLAAARARYPQRRLWVVWQPHTYSRTQALRAEFSASFTQADRVIVTEVYAAREKNDGFSSAVIVPQMRHPGAVFIPGITAVSQYLSDTLQPGDVVLVLSAGDADQVNTQLLANLTGKSVQHKETGK